MDDPFLNDPTLKDPDRTGTVKYGWDEEFQRHVAALLIGDRQFMLQSLDLVRPAYFTNKAHVKIVGIASEFFKKYRVLPRKEFILQELKTQLRENKSLAFYLGEVNVLMDYFQPGLEAREYLQDKIAYFAKIQTLKQAFQESLELIDKAPESEETWENVHENMRKAMIVHQNFEPGVDYFKSIKDRYVDNAVEEEENARFITGFPSVDLAISGGGYSRGESFSVVAGSGTGKSVALACMTATNLLRGKQGVYITNELKPEKIAARLDAILTGFPVQNLMPHKDAIYDKLTNLDGVKLEGAIWPLLIKHFAPGTLSVTKTMAYLAQLEFQGFNPDFVVLDYIGLMQDYPGVKIHESREKMVTELTGLADERKFWLATAMQPNRDFKKEGKENGRIDDHHLADAYGQIRPLFGCLSLMQNDTEKQLGIARGYVMKQRDGDSRFMFFLRFDRSNLRMTEISRDEYLSALNAHKEYVAEETKIDMVVEKWKPSDGEAAFNEVALAEDEATAL